jgi:hypothetical protein
MLMEAGTGPLAVGIGMSANNCVTFCSSERAVAIAVGQDEQEFFSSVAADRIAYSHRCGEPMSQVLEDLVTDDMTSIVYRLEVVDIDKHDCERLIGAMLSRDFLSQDLQNRTTIADTGECVVGGLKLESILCPEQAMLNNLECAARVQRIPPWQSLTIRQDSDMRPEPGKEAQRRERQAEEVVGNNFFCVSRLRRQGCVWIPGEGNQ